tara:strand:- start:368 stop:592 length:225 start_codon:yes stop_codon:yes gene_type:complete
MAKVTKTAYEMFMHELKKEIKKMDRKNAREAQIKRDQNSALREEDFHWTDASKYAEEHYGDRMRQTIGLDNDWD